MIRTGYISIFTLIAVAASLAAVPPDTSDSTTAVHEPRQTISIERLRLDSARSFDTLEITISPEYDVGGLDLKVATDSRLISIVDILPGEIMDSCRWEFFNARAVTVADGDSRLTSLWQVVALAEMFASEDTVLCRKFDREVSLMKVALALTPSWLPDDSAAAVFFYWEDCSDNTVAAASGDTLSLSVETVDFIKTKWPDTTGQFPTRRGAPPDCIPAKAKGRVRPRLVFQNGGVLFLNENDLLKKDSVEADSVLLVPSPR